MLQRKREVDPDHGNHKEIRCEKVCNHQGAQVLWKEGSPKQVGDPQECHNKLENQGKLDGKIDLGNRLTTCRKKHGYKAQSRHDTTNSDEAVSHQNRSGKTYLRQIRRTSQFFSEIPRKKDIGSPKALDQNIGGSSQKSAHHEVKAGI